MTVVGSPQAQQVICTLGMHRSGTSVVARMLNLLGVSLGTEEAISIKAPDNPKGYWEHHPIALINDEILARFGGRWDAPPAFPPSWLGEPRLADLKDEARRLLAEEFAAEALWGWKDPRTCFTLPFWQELVGPIRFVICLRNPADVAASLEARDGKSPEAADRLWITHVQSSLAQTSGQPRMFVFYEDVIDDWPAQLRRLAAFIGHRERGEDPGVHASVGEYLEKPLCHHRMSLDDLAGSPRISFASKSLYLALRGLAPQEIRSDETAGVDRARDSVQNTLDTIAARALETWDRMAASPAARGDLTQAATIDALRAERQRLATTVSALEALSADRHRLAEIAGAERNRLADALSTERGRRSADSGALDAEVRRLTIERDSQARLYQGALQELHDIRASSAWRLVTFYRRAIVALLPAGTRRRRLFDAVLRRIAHRADGHLRAA